MRLHKRLASRDLAATLNAELVRRLSIQRPQLPLSCSFPLAEIQMTRDPLIRDKHVICGHDDARIL